MPTINVRLPALDWKVPLVNPLTGVPTPYMQRFWQNATVKVEIAGDGAGDVTNKVDKRVTVSWSPATGTGSQATFVTYTAPVISNPPTQAEMQAVADGLEDVSQHLKTVIDALIVSDVFGL